jgi:hypothetical protein
MTARKNDIDKKKHNNWTHQCAFNITAETSDRLDEIASHKMRTTGIRALRSDVLREAVAMYIASFDAEVK